MQYMFIPSDKSVCVSVSRHTEASVTSCGVMSPPRTVPGTVMLTAEGINIYLNTIYKSICLSPLLTVRLCGQLWRCRDQLEGINIYLNTIYIYMMFIHSNSSKDHFMDFELGGHYYVTFDDR